MNKSYLKWAGSKQKALRHLLPIIEEFEFNIFVEPFVGAGNVSLNVNANFYILNDSNEDLIDLMKLIVYSDDTIFESFLHWCKVYFKYGHEQYYTIRDYFNDGKSEYVQKCAQFLYLNKHGFNGLCRYNKSGKFNVPKGSPKIKEVPIKELLFF